jgi:hypothetical protein
MKKVFLFALVAVLSIASASAQAYIGGSLGFLSSSAKPEGGEKITSSAFSFAPEVGYSLTEKLDLGIAVAFGSGKSGDLKTTGFGVAPYVRYSLVEFGKFSVLGKASLGIDSETEKDNGYKTTLTTFGLNVAPVLKYDLSDHFVLLANLNFLGLGFNQTTEKEGDAKLTRTGCGLGIDTDNVANVGELTIGFAYKF